MFSSVLLFGHPSSQKIKLNTRTPENPSYSSPSGITMTTASISYQNTERELTLTHSKPELKIPIVRNLEIVFKTLTKIRGSNFLRQRFLRPFFYANIFTPTFFYTKNFVTPKIFLRQIFLRHDFYANFFYAKKRIFTPVFQKTVFLEI